MPGNARGRRETEHAWHNRCYSSPLAPSHVADTMHEMGHPARSEMEQWVWHRFSAEPQESPLDIKALGRKSCRYVESNIRHAQRGSTGRHPVHGHVAAIPSRPVRCVGRGALVCEPDCELCKPGSGASGSRVEVHPPALQVVAQSNIDDGRAYRVCRRHGGRGREPTGDRGDGWHRWSGIPLSCAPANTSRLRRGRCRA